MSKSLPPLNGLKAFEATARHMSFTRAAEELNVTPAAVSHQVKGLEEFLGIVLFRRMNRAVELTEAGKLCFPGIQEGFETLKRSVGLLYPDPEDKILVVSSGPAFAAKWLAPRLYRFIEKHPEYDARISANLNRSTFGVGGVDIAIRFGDGNYPEEHVERFLDDRMTPMCAPSLLSGDKPLKRPEDLVNHTLIHDDSLFKMIGEPYWKSWLDEMGIEDVDPSRGPRFNHADHALDAAIAGSGVVLGRTSIAGPDLRAGRLVAPFDLWMETTRAFHFVCEKSAIHLPKIQAFRSWLWEERERDCAVQEY
ncbi:transcriptional regulator GcvA [Aestuariispira insulae]|uniref:LysR family transcriptional regulator n=1 Tax=Aestuariispira insulae TaxID=1461337 RepID=A0A3D9HS97_9PROT|nr:transcriptional regulator GcvA [Aestuariispira insulae]RED52364.1 LysR family transcriptional regulator [Aestuariispira insulae]